MKRIINSNIFSIDSTNFLDDLDLDTDRENCVTVIEWGGAESARLSDQRLEITIDRSQEVRGVSFNCVGSSWAGFSA